MERLNGHGFHEAYDFVSVQENGIFIPHLAAHHISEKVGRRDLYIDMLRILTTPETRSAVYADVFPFFKEVLRHGDPIAIWTQGEFNIENGVRTGYQAAKIADTGLLEQFGDRWLSNNSEWEIPIACGGRDKLSVLENHLKEGLYKNLPMTIIDDRGANLDAAVSMCKEAGKNVRGYIISRTLGEIDRNPVNCTHINSLDEVEMRDELEVYLIDLDYTLIDHRLVRKDLARRISDLIEMDGS